MKLNRFIKKALGVGVSALMISSFALTAGAWNESPADAETEATTAAPETDAEETTPDETTAEVTTSEPEAVLDDEIEDDPADTSEEPIETAPPEETAAPETVAPETTVAAVNTVAPDSYNAVEPFKMYVPEVLNVRGGPGTNYDKLGQVYANNVITIIGTSGEWYVFDYYGKDGYLLAELLTEVPATSATTETAPDADDVPSLDDNDGDISFDDTDTSPSETTPPENEATTQAPESDEAPSDDEDDDTVAAPVKEDKDNGSVPPLLLAFICAISTFLLIGVIPVLVHKAHHKKLYQY